jgi:ABC-2 type transport system ATP-binding protein
VRVRTPDLSRLAGVLGGPDVAVTVLEDGAAQVSGLSAEQVGDAAASAGVTLHELTPLRASLEDAYLQLTDDAVEYRSSTDQEIAR